MAAGMRPITSWFVAQALLSRSLCMNRQTDKTAKSSSRRTHHYNVLHFHLFVYHFPGHMGFGMDLGALRSLGLGAASPQLQIVGDAMEEGCKRMMADPLRPLKFWLSVEHGSFPF